jgi:hypothetical protein
MTIAQSYQSDPTNQCWYVEKTVPLLMMGGFMVHLIRLAQYLQNGTADLSLILLPQVDLVLTLLMIYCSIIMIGLWRRFFRVFKMSANWRKVVYWMITFYITASIPGHISYLAFGDTSYFNFFPWWFSPIIMVVYIAFIMYFFSLKPVRVDE